MSNKHNSIRINWKLTKDPIVNYVKLYRKEEKKEDPSIYIHWIKYEHLKFDLKIINLI